MAIHWGGFPLGTGQYTDRTKFILNQGFLYLVLMTVSFIIISAVDKKDFSFQFILTHGFMYKVSVWAGVSLITGLARGAFVWSRNQRKLQ